MSASALLSVSRVSAFVIGSVWGIARQNSLEKYVEQRHDDNGNY